MTTTLACRDETELLALAMGEPVPAAVTAHVEGCPMCRTKLDRLKAEVASLRQNHSPETAPRSTELDPAVDHDGEPSGVGTTMEKGHH
jgi:anti-sigma factor ChrR (cupin superfamily)